jgi:hypothetical protein
MNVSFTKGAIETTERQMRLNNPKCEVLINGIKHNYKRGILYTIHDRVEGRESFAKWCDREVHDAEKIRAFLDAYVETFGVEGRHAMYANKLEKMDIPNITGYITYHSIIKDKMLLAFERLGNRDVRRKELLYTTLEMMGSTPEDAARGYGIHPITGNLQYMRGILGVFLARNCPHSSLHYFNYGELDAFLPGERQALFVNPKLGAKNAENDWMPKKGSAFGRYSYDPVAAAAVPRPDQAILEAANAIRKKGKRPGARTTGPSAYTQTATNVTHP